MVLARRVTADSNRKYSAAEFLPCEYCLGFYLKFSLWQHISTCPLKPANKPPSNNYVRDARCMLTPFLSQTEETSAYTDELAKLLDGMKETSANPGIPNVCQADPIIRLFAQSQLDRLGTPDEQRKNDYDNIRGKVRVLARLLKEMNKDLSWKPLSDFITAQKFEHMVKAVKMLAIENNSPQVAIVLGHYMKHCSLLKLTHAIKTDCEISQKEAKEFQFLYQTHWNNQVSAVALRRQKLRQINKEECIPRTEDLVNLEAWLDMKMESFLHKQSFTEEESMAILVRIILFNKRRVSEVEEIRVDDFEKRPNMEENMQDIFSSLDLSERTLAHR